MFDPNAKVVEMPTKDDSTGESYVSLVAKSAGTFVNSASHNILSAVQSDDTVPSTPVVDLHFIPFYYRANRGGTGQMRVGLRKLK